MNSISEEALSNNAVQIVVRFNDALNAKDIDAVMHHMTHDCVFENTSPAPDGTRYVGHDAVRAFWEDFFKSASQIHFEIEDIFGFENRVVMRWVYGWTNTTGQIGHIRGVDVYTLSNGLIAEKLSYVKG
jgi:ketosteroid isomerase-like protein